MHTIISSEQSLKKVTEELRDLKKTFIDKEILIKLHLDKLSKTEQEIIKIKDKNKKLKIKMK